MAPALVTIAALRALIDEQLPGIPPTTRKAPPMNQPVPVPQQSPTPSPAVLPAGKLLAWAGKHSNKTIARKAERVHGLFAELRAHHAADEELAQVDAEEQRLVQELADLRARKGQLRPQRKAPARDYVPAEVRAWARAAGLDVPAIGTVPTTVVQAWRAAQNGGAQ